MKRIIFICILFFSLNINSQKDTTHFFKVLPDSTGIGVNDGKPINKEIGLQGGNIISDDEKVELVFPEGTLEKNKIISIQPTTNPAPNGTGKSYDLGALMKTLQISRKCRSEFKHQFLSTLELYTIRPVLFLIFNT
jgi:hypothetical protein